MCPACITTAVIMAASAGSTGGAVAFLHKKLSALRSTGPKRSQPSSRVSSQAKQESPYGGESSNAA
jgi:hypothetical protein